MTKQEIKFPVDWHYRIITDKSVNSCRENIISVLKNNQFDALPETGKESSGGKYLTWQVSVIFPSREIMEKLSAELAAIPGVKFIL
ncbi:MAG: DUF493 domain-containing protein [Victivallaceae bacterium]